MATRSKFFLVLVGVAVSICLILVARYFVIANNVLDKTFEFDNFVISYNPSVVNLELLNENLDTSVDSGLQKETTETGITKFTPATDNGNYRIKIFDDKKTIGYCNVNIKDNQVAGIFATFDK